MMAFIRRCRTYIQLDRLPRSRDRNFSSVSRVRKLRMLRFDEEPEHNPNRNLSSLSVVLYCCQTNILLSIDHHCRRCCFLTTKSIPFEIAFVKMTSRQQQQQMEPSNLRKRKIQNLSTLPQDILQQNVLCCLKLSEIFHLSMTSKSMLRNLKLSCDNCRNEIAFCYSQNPDIVDTSKDLEGDRNAIAVRMDVEEQSKANTSYLNGTFSCSECYNIVCGDCSSSSTSLIQQCSLCQRRLCPSCQENYTECKKTNGSSSIAPWTRCSNQGCCRTTCDRHSNYMLSCIECCQSKVCWHCGDDYCEDCGGTLLMSSVFCRV